MRKTSVFLAVLVAFISVVCLNGCGSNNSVTQYNISCTLEGNVLSGNEEVTFYNGTDNAITELKFNLFANAFREGAKHSPIGSQYVYRAYPNGMSYGNTAINKVTSGGKELEFFICGEDENILSVTLEREVFPEESVAVSIDFSVTLANVVARTGYTDKVINLANFYPILCGYDGGFYECVYYSNGDPFFSDCANYSVELTYEAQYVVASSGKLIRTHTSGEKTTSQYKIDNARSFAFVLSKQFESVTDYSCGVEIIYYFYQDDTPSKSMEYAKRSIELFSDKFGNYPYPTYSVVQTEFIQGGMEFPALVMISDNLEKTAYGEVIVHETAHQWWQGVVGNNEVEYGFLDEGLAEYSVVVFYENFSEYGMNRKDMISASEKTYKVFCSVYDKIFGTVNTKMTRSLKDFTSEYEYVNIAYIKPCIMYDTLRTTISDEKFFKALERYYKEYSFKNATPDDLVGVFEKSGADTNGFFESFFEGKAIL